MMVFFCRELFWCFRKENKDNEQEAVKEILKKENEDLGSLRLETAEFLLANIVKLLVYPEFEI